LKINLVLLALLPAAGTDASAKPLLPSPFVGEQVGSVSFFKFS